VVGKCGGIRRGGLNLHRAVIRENLVRAPIPPA